MLTVKEFVKQTLQQVLDATAEFSSENLHVGASANPSMHLQDQQGAALKIITDYHSRPTIILDFDLAVTAAETEISGQPTNLMVASIAPTDNDVTGTRGMTSVSRVKFSVPLRLENSEEHKRVKASSSGPSMTF